MSNNSDKTTVTLLNEDLPHYREAIKQRLVAIGEEYHGSYAQDVEIAALQRLADQIGGRFELSAGTPNFTVK